MRRHAIATIAALAALLFLDSIWLTLTTPILYRAELGTLLLVRPALWPAALFYPLYAIGVAVLAVAAAKSWSGALGRGALGRGALLGCVAYATYDLTNQATLRGWSGAVTVADIAWGTALTATAAALSFFAARRWG